MFFLQAFCKVWRGRKGSEMWGNAQVWENSWINLESWYLQLKGPQSPLGSALKPSKPPLDKGSEHLSWHTFSAGELFPSRGSPCWFWKLFFTILSWNLLPHDSAQGSQLCSLMSRQIRLIPFPEEFSALKCLNSEISSPLRLSFLASADSSCVVAKSCSTLCDPLKCFDS